MNEEGTPIKDSVTPHRISMLLLVKDYVEIGMESMAGNFSGDFKYMKVLLQLVQGPELELVDLLHTLQVSLPYFAVTRFRNNLQRLCKPGVFQFTDFFLNLELPGPVVQKNSALYLILRRMLAWYWFLQLYDIGHICVRLRSYASCLCGSPSQSMDALSQPGSRMQPQLISDPSQSQSRIPPPVLLPFTPSVDESGDMMSMMTSGFDQSVVAVETPGGHSIGQPSDQAVGKSVDQTDALPGRSLLSGISRLQFDELVEEKHQPAKDKAVLSKYLTMVAHSDQSLESLAALEEEMEVLIQENRSLCEPHYVSYLCNLVMKDLPAATKSLHSYFDAADRSQNFETGKQGGGKGSQRKKRPFRYASFNLAKLYCRFGHKEVARTLVRETVHLAQDSNDSVCLQHALSLYYHLCDQGPLYTSHLMEKANLSAAVLKLPSLISLNSVSLALHKATTGSRPTEAFEHLRKSDALQLQTVMTHNSKVQGHLWSLHCQASLWGMYGVGYLQCLLSQSLLDVSFPVNGVSHVGEEEITALCALSRAHFMEGDYRTASALLAVAEDRSPRGGLHSQRWELAKQQQLFERAFLRGDYSTLAAAAVNNIGPMAGKDAKFRYARVLLKQRKFADSELLLREVLQSIREESEESKDKDRELELRARLELGRLFVASGDGSVGLDLLRVCLQTAHEKHLMGLCGQAGLALAQALFSEGQCEQARCECEKVYILLKMCGFKLDQAQAELLCLQTSLSPLLTNTPDTDLLRTTVTEALTKLVCITDVMDKCEAVEELKAALVYKAALQHKLGDRAGRNETALAIKKVVGTLARVPSV